MALNFPASPVDGQIYFDTTSGNTYKYNSSKVAWLANNDVQGFSTNEQVIFNDVGISSGNTGLTFNKTSNTLTANVINSYSIIVNNNLIAQTVFVGGSSIPTGNKSNTTFSVANSAFDKANSANVLAFNTGIGANNYAGAMANSANAYAASLTPDLSPAFNKANSANVIASAAFDKANSANVLAFNTGIGANNYAGAMANSANAYAASLTPDLSPAFNKANSANVIASAAFDKANSANVLAFNTGIGANNYAGAMANASNAYAASLTPDLSPAFNKANSANVLAFNTGIGANNYAGVMANSANAYANNTFLKFTATSQIITGSLEITGNLILSGNATSISTDNLSVQDPLVFLAANNISDIVDIGLVGHYSNGSANVHTGIYRDHASKEYFLFNGLSGEPQLLNDIVPYANNMVNAVLNSHIRTSNLNLGGANAIVWITSGYDVANAAFARGNTSAQLAFYRVTANGSNLDAVSNADTLTISSSNNIVLIANSTNDSIQITQSPSGVTATTYGGATQIPVIVVDTYGRLTSASNVAVNGMDYPYVNTSTASANNWANTKLANTTNTVFSGNLITSGVVRSKGLQDSTGRLLLIKDSAGTVVWGN